MASRQTLLISTLLALVGVVLAESVIVPRAPTASEIEDSLQECTVVQSLNAHKAANTPETTGFMVRLFRVLFPGSPAINALLATAYISGPPNIDPASLSVMVAFAVGGLLGDTLFHLLPEIFLGEEPADSVRFVLVEPNRNLLLGLAIMIGFLTFVVMDKALRIASGGEGGHDHGHSHAGEPATAVTTGSKGKDKGDKGLKKRKSTPALAAAEPAAPPTTARDPSAQLGGILNMAADFTHNITDGLALASSFYASPAVGATTTVAVFFHEIPHEVGDFALLVRAGFSKRRAMGAQFITAVGAFLGTLLGIAIQEGLFTPSAAGGTGDAGLFGTSLTAGDLLLPFTAGTFLYVGTVAVVPELLETPPPAGGSADRGWRLHEAGKAGRQLVAVAFGAGIMLWISWA